MYVVVECKNKNSEPFRTCSGLLSLEDAEMVLEIKQEQFAKDKTFFKVMQLVDLDVTVNV